MARTMQPSKDISSTSSKKPTEKKKVSRKQKPAEPKPIITVEDALFHFRLEGNWKKYIPTKVTLGPGEPFLSEMTVLMAKQGQKIENRKKYVVQEKKGNEIIPYFFRYLTILSPTESIIEWNQERVPSVSANGNANAQVADPPVDAEPEEVNLCLVAGSRFEDFDPTIQEPENIGEEDENDENEAAKVDDVAPGDDREDENEELPEDIIDEVENDNVHDGNDREEEDEIEDDNEEVPEAIVDDVENDNVYEGGDRGEDQEQEEQEANGRNLDNENGVEDERARRDNGEEENMPPLEDVVERYRQYGQRFGGPLSFNQELKTENSGLKAELKAEKLKNEILRKQLEKSKAECKEHETTLRRIGNLATGGSNHDGEQPPAKRRREE